MESTIEIIEPKLFSAGVADEIVASVNDCISEKGRCSLVLAGGSTPSQIYRLLARPPRVDEIEWDKLHLYWGDERWVPFDDVQSNFKMVNETWLSQLSGVQPKIHPVNTALASPDESARDYAKVIRENENLKEGELPTFDVVLLGVGEDGHTASLFPGSDIVRQEGGIAFPVKHPVDGSPRVTLSPDTLFSARRVLFIVKGESKADIIKRVITGTDGPDVFPATLFKKVPDRVSWFLDSGAAQKLDLTKR